MKKQKYKRFEVEECECGHEAPIFYTIYNDDGNGTCLPCHIEYLEDKLSKAKKNIKDLKKELNNKIYRLC